MKVYQNIFSLIVVLCSIFSTNIFAADSIGYIYEHEVLSHLNKVTAKDHNADVFDPASGMISFTATDILLPGSSQLKVQLRRVLTTGEGNATNGFGGYTHPANTNSGLPGLDTLSHWSLDVPHIYANTLAGENIQFIYNVGDGNWLSNDECTGNIPPRLQRPNRGASRDSYIEPDEYWSGATLHIPGEVTEQFLKAETNHPNYSGALRTTKSNWVYNTAECYQRDDQARGERGGFVVKSPDGRKFYFDVKKDVWRKNPPEPILNFTEKVRRIIFVSRIEDKFGNWVNYNWQNGFLNSIEANDGRKIDFHYGRQNRWGMKYLTSATAHGKEWQYDAIGYGAINKVTYPDGSELIYKNDFYAGDKDYSTELRDRTDNNGNKIPAGVCDIALPLAQRPTKEMVITDADGLVNTYKFRQTAFARFEASTSLVGEWARGLGYHNLKFTNANCTHNLALFEKTITGPGLPSSSSANALKWTYEYSENAGTYEPVDWADNIEYEFLLDRIAKYDSYVGNTINIPNGNLPNSVRALGEQYLAKVRTTVVNSPTGKKRYYVNRDARSANEDKIIAVDTIDPKTGSLLRRVETTYEQGVKVGKQLAGTKKPGEKLWSSHNLAKLQYRSNSAKIQTKQLGDTYTTDQSYDDFYGAVKGTVESGPRGATKHTSYTYVNDIKHWHLSQPEKTALSKDGSDFQVVKATKYQTMWYPNSNQPMMPKYVYLGDFTTDYIKQYSFNDDGTLSSVGFNENLLNANGTQNSRRRFQRFSDYYRGVPRTVTMPNRYNTNDQTLKVKVDDFGQIEKYTDLDGKVTHYTFDKLGRIATVNYADTTVADTKFVWSTDYDARPKRDVYRCSLDTSSNCYNILTQETSTYDALLRPLIIKNKELSTGKYNYIKKKYNAAGTVEFESYPATYSSSFGRHYEYDALQRLTSISTDYLGTQQTEYLSVNRKKFTDEMGNETTTWYKAYGSPNYTLPTAINSPEGVGTVIEYDVFDNPTHITQQGPGTPPDTYLSQYNTYDQNRRLCKVSRKDVGTTVYQYNTVGELTHSTQMAYTTPDDCNGNNTNKRVSHTYDNLGSPWKVTYPGQTADKVYTHSPQGDLLKLTAGYVTQTYTYTGNHWLDTEKFELDGSAWLFDYGRDKLGNMTSLKYPNNHLVNYAPNGFGQATKATRDGFNYALDASYYDNGTLNSFTYGNGLTHKTYLGSNKLPSQVKDYRSGFTAVDKTYKYYDNLSVKSIKDNVNPAYSINNMIYDGLDRLTNVSGGSGIGSSTLRYDALGNIKYYASKGRALTYSYNANNQISKVTDSVGNKGYYMFVHDESGNITYNSKRGFTYDLNNLITKSGSNSYIYDGHNRRIKSIDSKGTTYSLYNTSGTLLYRQNNNKGVNYVHLGKKLIAKDGEGGTGSSSGLTHSRPFGESIEPPKNDVGYTGHLYDTDLGLNYMQARYYDPVIGRFYSNDPVSFNGNIHTFNRYTYAANNPYKYVDPDGKLFFLAIPAAITLGQIIVDAAVITLGAAMIADGLSDDKDSNLQFAKKNKKEKNKGKNSKQKGKTQRGDKDVTGNDPEETNAEQKTTGARGSRATKDTSKKDQNKRQENKNKQKPKAPEVPRVE